MSTSTRAVTSPVGRSLGSRRLKGALPSVTSLAPDHFTEPESPQGDASLNPLRAPRTCEKPVLRARRQKEGTATVQRVFLSVSPTRSAIASFFLVLKKTSFCSSQPNAESWFHDLVPATGRYLLQYKTPVDAKPGHFFCHPFVSKRAWLFIHHAHHYYFGFPR